MISHISKIYNANRNMTVHKTKFFISLILVVSMLIVQTGGVFSVSALQTSPALEGTIQSITLETSSTTGMKIVIVTVMDREQFFQTVRIGEKTAQELGLVMFDGDGKLVINGSALGQQIEISPEMVLPSKGEERHPVGNALATYFSNIPGLDYNTIMLAHNDGVRFRVIARALWLTTKLKGNVNVFQALLLARETGDFKEFTFEDGTVPKSWAELRKGIDDGKKVEDLDSVMSNPDDENGNNSAPYQDKGKKDKQKDKDKDGGGKKDKEKTK